MLQLYVCSKCCGSGYGYLLKIYKKLKELNIEAGIMSINYDDKHPMIAKYGILRKNCPTIIIDSMGISFIANELDKDNFFNSLIDVLSKTKQPIVTK